MTSKTTVGPLQGRGRKSASSSKQRAVQGTASDAAPRDRSNDRSDDLSSVATVNEASDEDWIDGDQSTVRARRRARRSMQKRQASRPSDSSGSADADTRVQQPQTAPAAGGLVRPNPNANGSASGSSARSGAPRNCPICNTTEEFDRKALARHIRSQHTGAEIDGALLNSLNLQQCNACRKVLSKHTRGHAKTCNVRFAAPGGRSYARTTSAPAASAPPVIPAAANPNTHADGKHSTAPRTVVHHTTVRSVSLTSVVADTELDPTQPLQPRRSDSAGSTTTVATADLLNIMQSPSDLQREAGDQKQPEVDADGGARAPADGTHRAMDDVADHYRLRSATHRTIPDAAVPALIRIVRPILQRYSDAIEAERPDEADAMIVEFLDVPGKALYVQRNARGGARTIRRQLEAHGNGRSAELSPEQLPAPSDKQVTDVERAAIRTATRTIDAGGSRALHRAAKGLAESGKRRVEINADTLSQLRALHPDGPRRIAQLPESTPPARVLCGKEFTGLLVKTLKSMCSGASPGPSGWTEELLLTVAVQESCIANLALMVANISQGAVGGIAADLLRACELRPIPKPYDSEGVRPIGMGEALVKLAAQVVFRPLTQRLPGQPSLVDRIFGSIQFGVTKPGGAEAAAGVLQLMLLSDPSRTVLALDYKNAFNVRARNRIADAMYSERRLSPTWRLFDFLYGTPSALLVHDNEGRHRDTIRSSQGVRQGCVLGSLAFAVSMQHAYERAEQLSGATCVAVADDVSFCGTLAQCKAAAQQLMNDESLDDMQVTRRKCKLLVQQRACTVTRTTHPDGSTTVTDTPPNDHKEFATEFGCELHTGAMPVLGTAIGDDNTKRRALSADSCAARNCAYFDTLARPHANGGFRPHHAFQLLKASAIPRLNYIIRTLPASTTDNAAKWFDTQVMRVLLSLLNRNRPLSAIQRVCSRLPLSTGGLGLRGMETTAPAAFLGGTAQALASAPDWYKRLPPPTALLDAVQEALNRLAANGVTRVLVQQRANSDAKDGDVQGAQLHAEQLRAQASAHNAECKSAQHFVDHYMRLSPHVISDMHVQRSITLLVEDAMHANIADNAHADGDEKGPDQSHVRLEAHARLRSCAGKGASLWLRPISLAKQGILSSTVFARALRLRIGLTPFDADVLCVCGTPVRDDDHGAMHIHSCVPLRKIAGDARHNAVRDALARIARNAGTDCVVEYVPQNEAAAEAAPASSDKLAGAQLDAGQLPAQASQPSGELSGSQLSEGAAPHNNPVDPTDASETERRQRPDLKLYGSGMELLSDVCITNPSCATYRLAASKRNCHAATIMEKRKIAKYSDIAKREGAQLIPCVIESYGALGNSAMQLITTLSKHRTQQSADDGAIPAIGYRSWAMSILSAATQRAHSVMVDVAYRHMRRRAMGRARSQPWRSQ